jgi:hypothetical protein
VYQDGGTLPYFVFTASIASVLLTDLMSARLVQSVLAPLVARRRALLRPADGPPVDGVR